MTAVPAAAWTPATAQSWAELVRTVERRRREIGASPFVQSLSLDGDEAPQGQLVVGEQLFILHPGDRLHMPDDLREWRVERMSSESADDSGGEGLEGAAAAP